MTSGVVTPYGTRKLDAATAITLCKMRDILQKICMPDIDSYFYFFIKV